MKTKKEIEKYLNKCIEANNDNENRDVGWNSKKATELRAEIRILKWILTK